MYLTKQQAQTVQVIIQVWKEGKRNLPFKLRVHSNLRHLVLLFLFFVPQLFLVQAAFAQGLPFIENYTEFNLRQTTNWSVVQDNRGVLFVGNQIGIVQLNNHNDFRFIELPNTSVVRSLKSAKNGIVYVGAQKEFGYLKPSKNGHLHYQSLVPKLNEQDKKFTEVCKVYDTKDGVCFQTFEGLYFYKQGKFKVIKPSSTFHFSFYVNDVLYVLERGVGLEVYSNGSLQLVTGGQAFSDDRIYSILPYGRSKLLIAAREGGLFLYDLNTKNLKPFSENVSRFLIENHVYDALQLNNETFVFGTLRGGLITMSKDGTTYRVYDKTNLLLDNKVNALYLDNSNNLWVALDQSLSKIEFNSPFTFYNDKDGISGTISAITKFENKIYVCTTLGVFCYDGNLKRTDQFYENKFKQLSLKAECFSFLKATFKGKERLFVVSQKGMYEIQDLQLDLVLEDFCFTAFQSTTNENKVYVGLKNGVAALTLNGATWETEYPEKNIMNEITTIAEDEAGNIWLGAKQDGIYRIDADKKKNFSTADGATLFTLYDTVSGLPTNEFNRVFRKDDKVIFGTITGFYSFDYSKNKFYSDSAISKAIDGQNEKQIADFLQFNSNEYLVLNYSSEKGTTINQIKKNATGYESIYSKPYKRLYKSNISCFYTDSLKKLLIGTSRGLLLLDLKVKKNFEQRESIILNSVILGEDSALFDGSFYETQVKDGDSLLVTISKQPDSFIPHIAYAYNNISFNFDYAYYEDASSNEFSYYLEGYEPSWKNWSTETKAVYNNLNEGHYKLHLKARNIYNTQSEEFVYEFYILSPWYRTWCAYVIYTVVIVGFLYILVQLSVRRLKMAKLALENTVKERTSEIVKQSEEIQNQKNIVELKNKDITDSINYAKRIQDTILPPDDEINRLLPNCFLLFLPKDILSGDFYWIDEIDNRVLVAAVDCTGHGVPGALMSIVGNNILNQTILEHKISKPSTILDELNKGVTYTLRQKNEESKVKDGMDIVLLSINFQENIVEFAGANNPLYHIRNGELTEIKGDKFPIGIFIGEEVKHFTNHEIQLQKGDTLYLFTDGYADQFGGPKGKKFKYNQFKSTLLQMQHLSIKEQRTYLLNTIKSWQGSNDQVDDILVIGIKL